MLATGIIAPQYHRKTCRHHAWDYMDHKSLVLQYRRPTPYAVKHIHVHSINVCEIMREYDTRHLYVFYLFSYSNLH